VSVERKEHQRDVTRLFGLPRTWRHRRRQHRLGQAAHSKRRSARAGFVQLEAAIRGAPGRQHEQGEQPGMAALRVQGRKVCAILLGLRLGRRREKRAGNSTPALTASSSSINRACWRSDPRALSRGSAGRAFGSAQHAFHALESGSGSSVAWRVKTAIGLSP